MFSRFVAGACCAVAFSATADVVKTNVWIKIDGTGGFWSNAANWENGEKPATDGSSFVIISNELANTSVGFTVYVDENVNVRHSLSAGQDGEHDAAALCLRQLYDQDRRGWHLRSELGDVRCVRFVPRSSDERRR